MDAIVQQKARSGKLALTVLDANANRDTIRA